MRKCVARQAQPMSLHSVTIPRMRHFRRHYGRIYSLFPPAQDLLGDWVVLTVHGSTRNRLGNVKSYPADSRESAVKIEARIARTRILHGYAEEEAA